jgi:NADPH:quinone reductase-like Zn-dependent oxidoreductase
MRAFLLHSYGPADHLRPAEIDQPVPADDEVLVRVRATSVNPYDWHHMRGEPYVARLMPGTLGVRKPKLNILGADIAGVVEAVGRGVTEFRSGDEVFAQIKQGGFAEYVCVRESQLAPKPKNLSFEEAAAVPLAANTALLGVRDQGRVQPGQKVLINGASGGVGTFAVQLARAFGAEVTGVCGTRNLDLVRSIGAHHVLDYTKGEFPRNGRHYDLLLDVAGGHSGSACRRVLTSKGSYVAIGGPAGRWLQPAGHIFSAVAAGPLVSQRVAMVEVVAEASHQANLMLLTEFIEAGKITPVIDRRYSFEEIPAAVAYQEQGHAAGKVVITV